MQKALCLWLNSSFGVLSFFSRRVVTRSTFVGMKQPAWLSMPVLNVFDLSEGQRSALASSYDQLAEEALAPLAQLDTDPVRKKIDDALCAAFEWPSIAPIRQLLAREPGLSGRNIAPEPTRGRLDLPEARKNDEDRSAPTLL